MLKVPQLKKALYPLVAATALFGAAATTSLAKDINKPKETEIIETSVTDKKGTTTQNPIGTDTYAYATLFTLGLLGSAATSGVIKKEKNKLKNIEEESKKLNLLDASITDNNRLCLVYRSGYLSKLDKSVDTEKYSLDQIREMIFLAVDKEYKPSILTPDILEDKEVQAFMENVSLNYSFSQPVLTEQIAKTLRLPESSASGIALSLHFFAENTPLESRKAVIDICMGILQELKKNNKMESFYQFRSHTTPTEFLINNEEVAEKIAAEIGGNAPDILKNLINSKQEKYALKYLLEKYNTLVQGVRYKGFTTEEILKEYPNLKVVDLKGTTAWKYYSELEKERVLGPQ